MPPVCVSVCLQPPAPVCMSQAFVCCSVVDGLFSCPTCGWLHSFQMLQRCGVWTDGYCVSYVVCGGDCGCFSVSGLMNWMNLIESYLVLFYHIELYGTVSHGNLYVTCNNVKYRVVSWCMVWYGMVLSLIKSSCSKLNHIISKYIMSDCIEFIDTISSSGMMNLTLLNCILSNHVVLYRVIPIKSCLLNLIESWCRNILVELYCTLYRIVSYNIISYLIEWYWIVLHWI